MRCSLAEKGNTMKEKLIDLLEAAPGHANNEIYSISEIADHLIANGVTIPVRCKECRYYKEDGEYCGFWGELRHSEHFCDEGVSDNG